MQMPNTPSFSILFFFTYAYVLLNVAVVIVAATSTGDNSYIAPEWAAEFGTSADDRGYAIVTDSHNFGQTITVFMF